MSMAGYEAVVEDVVRKRFFAKNMEQRKEILWSLDAGGIEAKVGGCRICAMFADEYQLYGWAQTFRRWFGYVPCEEEYL